MLTIKEIITRAPAAAATKPAASCSPKYVMVPTLSMVEVLHQEGWLPVEAKQVIRKDSGWGENEHAKHMIRFRKRGTESLSRRQMTFGVVPELLMVNGSDGLTGFELDIGMFRVVCSNGLIVKTSIAGMQLKHQRITAESVIANARALSSNTKPLFDKIEAWSKIRLNPLAQKRYAQQAMALRVGDDKAKLYDPNDVLKVRRAEDEEPTLWNVFNRTQEACMLGDINRVVGSARLRRINAINQEVSFNKALWEQTEKWAALTSR